MDLAELDEANAHVAQHTPRVVRLDRRPPDPEGPFVACADIEGGLHIFGWGMTPWLARTAAFGTMARLARLVTLTVEPTSWRRDDDGEVVNYPLPAVRVAGVVVPAPRGGAQ